MFVMVLVRETVEHTDSAIFTSLNLYLKSMYNCTDEDEAQLQVSKRLFFLIIYLVSCATFEGMRIYYHGLLYNFCNAIFFHHTKAA